MRLPPVRHPAWLMVATIACLGAALTSSMAGSRRMALALLSIAIVLALASGLRFRRLRRDAETVRRR
jgi:hypothetical protein